MTLEAQIEALLFWKNEAVTIKWLSKAVEKTEDEVKEALLNIEKSLEGRGFVLQRNGDETALKTTPAASDLIEKFSKDELAKELTPSALETLSIIAYRGPLSKKEIDYIRGVNSGFILRNLLIRGLIEKEDTSPQTGNKGIVYKPSLELLSLLGITKLEELEEYEAVGKEIESFKTNDVEHQSN